MVEEELLRNDFIVLEPALPRDGGSGYHVSQVDPGTGHLALQTGLHGPKALSRLSRPQHLANFLLALVEVKVGPNFLVRSPQQKVERAKLAR